MIDLTIAVKFSAFIEEIQAATTYDEVIAVCRAIDSMDPALFKKHTNDETFYLLNPQATDLTKLLCRVFQTSKDLSFHLKVMKAILKPALCMNYFFVEQLLSWYEKEISSLGAECLRVYTWIQNFKHIETVNVFLPDNLRIAECFEDGSLKYSTETRYFALSIENMITAYDCDMMINHQFWLTIILTNLENSHQNVHKLLLELYKRMVMKYKEGDYGDNKLVEKVIELPWTSRNKYPLLAHLISVNHEFLLKSPNFRMADFIDGLQVGLTLHHLLAPSQTLVKVLRGKDTFKQPLIEMFAQVMWHGDEKIAINLIKFWFSTLNEKEQVTLFNTMNKDRKFDANISTTSDKFYRLLLLRNAFKKIFAVPGLDIKIRQFACDIDDLPLKIEIFHVLMENVQTESDQLQRLEDVLIALKFIRFNITIEESSFVDQHIMRKLPDFFNLLASKKMSYINVLKEIFAIVRDDIFLQGFEINSYESITFSLKFLNVILKQYCGSSGARLSRNTNYEGNLSFGKYLKDNEIWNVTSPLIFNQLIKLMKDNENGDINELAMRLLVEYFIKKQLVEDLSVEGENFVTWIDKKVETILNQPTINASPGADRHFILKFEYLLSKGLFDQELQSMINDLKQRFVKLKNEDDPVASMENGSNLFKLIDCINFGMKRLEPAQVKFQSIPVLSILLKIITTYFLNYMSDENQPPSFELLDQKVMALLGKSSCPEANSCEMKPKLIFFIWYTLRATCEASETIVSIVKTAIKPSDKEYRQVMQTCLDINIQVLSQCCHKGVIDSASRAIGSITKMISDEYSKLWRKQSMAGKNLHSLLVTLKGETDCGKRESGDARSARGVMVMAHKIINSRPPFLKFLVENLLVIVPLKRFEDNFQIKFCDNIKPIQLHLLAALIRDGDLVEEMLRFYDLILLATFKAYKESKDFVVENALLQIIGAIVPKLANQKRHLMGEDDSVPIRYEPKAVTAYEFYVKATYAFRVALYDMTHQGEPLSTTYTIVLLEIFSNFEYRYPGENWSEIEAMRDIFRRLMFHQCDKVRLLAGKCFSQWHDNKDGMLKIIKDDLELLFSSDGNVVSSTAHCLTLMIQRYESNVKFVTRFDIAEFKSLLRDKISKKFATQKFVGANNFFIRYHLFDFLMFLNFTFNNEVVQSLMIEEGLTSHFGYKMWSEKMKQMKIKI